MSNHTTDKKELILWADVETTGTNAYSDYLLEVGALFTDMQGNKIGHSFSEVLDNGSPKNIADAMDDLVTQMHTKNHLFEEICEGKGIPLSNLDSKFEKWITETAETATGENVSDVIIYFGGRSMNLDRAFLSRHAPRAYGLISYRGIDMTSVCLLLQRNNIIENEEVLYVSDVAHRALDDSAQAAEQYRRIVEALQFFRDGAEERDRLLPRNYVLESNLDEDKKSVLNYRPGKSTVEDVAVGDI